MERLATLMPVGSEDRILSREARRRSQRFTLNAEVAVLSPVAAEGLVLNASAGGLRVVLYREIPVGSLCVLEVILPGDRRAAEHARVVWSRRHADGWVMGLEFVGVH